MGLLDAFLNPPKKTTEVKPDIETPRWTTSAEQAGLLDEAGQMTFKSEHHGHAGVRTIHGALDLVSDIAEEVTDWETRVERQHDPSQHLPEDLRRVLAPSPRPLYVLADILPSRGWHTETLTIPVGNAALTDQWTLLSARVDRMWIEIVNQGANPLLISFTDDPNFSVAGSFAAITLPNTPANTPYVPRRFPVGGKVYAYSVLGTVVDYVEAYGARNFTLDYVNP